MAASVYQFGDFRLDSGSFLLLRNGHSLRLERKPLELLILLVSSGSRLVTRAEIAECLWGKDVFVDTEHGINTAVRKIRAALRDDPETPRFVQTVTGMGYRFIAPTEVVAETEDVVDTEVVGEGLAATRAAAVPPAGKLLQAEGGHALPVGSATSRRAPGRLWWGIAAVATALCAGGALAVDRGLLHGHMARESGGQPIHSIAVLPLANYTGDPNQEYFADGMTDELITMLARDSTLRIPSRTSVMHYKTTDRSLGEVAKALGVDGILEGSVSRSTNRVHLNLQLIRADTDSHLWAESYDRSLTQVAALPEEAARAIATHLNSASAARSPARYVHPEAHDAFLRGQYFWWVGRNEEAGRAFERAVALQPDYASGWAGVSQYYSAGAYSGHLDPMDSLPKAEAAAERAVALDDSLPQAHNSLAAAIFFKDWDGERALQEVSRATELDPQSSQAYHLQALMLSAMGRFGEALAAQARSTAADPVTHPGAMAEILFFAREYDRSLAEAEMRLRDFPESKDLLDFAAAGTHRKGLDSEAAGFLARLYSPAGDSRPNQAVLQSFRSGGYPGVAKWRIGELRSQAKNHYVSPTHLAHLYAELGDREQAFSLLEQALRIRDPILLFIDTDPAYAAFHLDSRYRSLIQRIGLQRTPQ